MMTDLDEDEGLNEGDGSGDGEVEPRFWSFKS